MKTVDVVLRTHSGANVHGGERVFKGLKTDLILGCLRSLLRTMKRVDPRLYTLRLSILDDHSEPRCVNGMKALSQGLPFPVSIVPLETRGVGPSFGAAYSYARELSSDIIYFVEDDYLHTESALPEMLEAQELFSKNLGGREVAIFPVDYPDNYNPTWIKPSYLVLGPKRHWHTDFSTTGTFLISKPAFMRNFAHCMKMSLYMIDMSVNEENSLNNIWREGGVQLFSPVPSLALHMQDDSIISPYVDWRDWWNRFGLPGPDLPQETL